MLDWEVGCRSHISLSPFTLQAQPCGAGLQSVWLQACCVEVCGHQIRIWGGGRMRQVGGRKLCKQLHFLLCGECQFLQFQVLRHVL